MIPIATQKTEKKALRSFNEENQQVLTPTVVACGDCVKALLTGCLKIDENIRKENQALEKFIKLTSQICNLIFFPLKSTVFILKSIPETINRDEFKSMHKLINFNLSITDRCFTTCLQILMDFQFFLMENWATKFRSTGHRLEFRLTLYAWLFLLEVMSLIISMESDL